MSEVTEFDEFEPIGRVYRRYRFAIRSWCLALLYLLLLVVVYGVPHIQTTYTYTGHRPQGRSPSATQKLDAWYFSVTGWKHLEADQYGYRGCPVILFIPLSDCFDSKSVESSF